MAAPSDVLTYIIYIIKEVAEGIEHRVGLRIVLDGIGIHYDAYALGLHCHVHVGIGHDWVAVIVYGSGLVTVHLDALGTEGLDF